MIKNIYGYSWWAIAVVALNLPWMNYMTWLAWREFQANGSFRGWFWFGPIIIWGWSAAIVSIIWIVAMFQTRSSRGLRGRWLAWTGLGMLLTGPFALILQMIYDKLK